MTQSLRDKVVVVTGAARGQGRAEVELFRSLGAVVVGCDVLDGADRHLDVTDAPAWQALVADLVATHGRVDVLVNNAGVFRRAPLGEWTPDQLRRVLDVNLVGPILGMQAVAPVMPRGSAIVNVASTAAVHGVPGALPYSSSKWGLRGATRSAALELAPAGIRVNCVCPGLVDTPMVDVATLDVSGLPMARAGEAAEVARLVAFLASDDASYCNGAEFVIDGGATA